MRQVIIGTALFGMLVGSLHRQAQAQSPTENYEAVIDAAEVQVRSGPGADYYPTTTLKRGTRVTVLRHEPGGWLRIVPPPGSFSWIAKDCVDPLPGNRGRVNKSNFFRIGSQFDVELTARHRILIGEEVEILGEQVLQTERGAVAMYKIRPPIGEHRWIPGQAAVPADGKFRQLPGSPASDLVAEQAGKPEKSAAEPTEVDPFAQAATPGGRLFDDPAGGTAPAKSTGEELVNRPTVRISADGSYRRVAPPVDELNESRSQLKALDVEFRRIVGLEKSEWDFASLEREYLELRDTTPLPAFQAHVDLRLDAVRRYQAEKVRYDEFMRVAAETSQRDAQLLALQRQITESPTAAGDVEAQPAAQSVPQPSEDPVSPFQEVGPQAVPAPSGEAVSEPGKSPAPSGRLQAESRTKIQAGPPASRPVPPSQPAAAAGGTQPAGAVPPGSGTGQPRFSGAGIVQRAAWVVPNGPRHVLLTPNGRVLAYLQAGPGIDLDRYVGQSVGVVGPRGFRRDLMTDFIQVQQLAPVRLR